MYSRTEFTGYTHRFLVQFDIGETYYHSLEIYSNSDSYQSLEEFINEKKSSKVRSFSIVHRATKEQDEMSAQIINEILDNI